MKRNNFNEPSIGDVTTVMDFSTSSLGNRKKISAVSELEGSSIRYAELNFSNSCDDLSMDKKKRLGIAEHEKIKKKMKRIFDLKGNRAFIGSRKRVKRFFIYALVFVVGLKIVSLLII